MALLTLLEDFELASDFPDLPEAEATPDGSPWLLGALVGEDDMSDDLPLMLGALVGEEDTSGDLPKLLGALVGEEDTSDDLPTLGAADSARGLVTGYA